MKRKSKRRFGSVFKISQKPKKNLQISIEISIEFEIPNKLFWFNFLVFLKLPKLSAYIIWIRSSQEETKKLLRIIFYCQQQICFCWGSI